MFKVVKDMRLSKNFSLSEFVCKEGRGEVFVDMLLVEKLQELRDMVGKPISIVSGYRSEAYNRKCGGAKKSQHLFGKAADLQIVGMPPKQVVELAEDVGFDGIGVYSTFVHVDVRGYRARWSG